MSLLTYSRDEQNYSNFQLPQREAGNTQETRAVIRKEQEVKPLPAGEIFFKNSYVISFLETLVFCYQNCSDLL